MDSVKNGPAQRSLLRELKKLYTRTSPAIKADLLSELVRRDGENTFDKSNLLQLRSVLCAQKGMPKKFD